jgi:Na+/H+-dicarboxylate symporters
VDNSKFFGDLFIRLLKMIVVPVILFSLIAGAASIAPGRLGRVGIKIMIYYLLTSAFAVLIGLVFANILQPGAGFNIVGAAGIQGKAAAAPSIATILLNIVPTNPIDSLAKGDVLPIIFFAVVFGIALSYIKDASNKELAKAGGHPRGRGERRRRVDVQARVGHNAVRAHRRIRPHRPGLRPTGVLRP